MKHSYKDCVKVIHEEIISLTKECLLEEQNFVILYFGQLSWSH